MPKIRDILTDGPEYIRRSIRREKLRRRLRNERTRFEHLLYRLGRKAWELQVPVAAKTEAASKLRDLTRRLDKEAGELDGSIKDLEEETGITAHEALALEKDIRRRALELKLLDRRYARRSDALINLEREVSTAQRRKESLIDNLAFLEKQLEGLEHIPDKDKKTKRDELDAAIESNESRIKEATRELRNSRRRLRTSKEALSPIKEQLESSRGEFSVLTSRRPQLRRQLQKPERELRKSREKYEQSLTPIKRREAELHKRLGESLLTRRTDEPKLVPFFSALDLCRSTIESLENDVRSETVLLELLDPEAVDAFFGIAAAAGVSALLSVALLTAIILFFL